MGAAVALVTKPPTVGAIHQLEQLVTKYVAAGDAHDSFMGVLAWCRHALETPRPAEERETPVRCSTCGYFGCVCEGAESGTADNVKLETYIAEQARYAKTFEEAKAKYFTAIRKQQERAEKAEAELSALKAEGAERENQTVITALEKVRGTIVPGSIRGVDVRHLLTLKIERRQQQPPSATRGAEHG